MEWETDDPDRGNTEKDGEKVANGISMEVALSIEMTAGCSGERFKDHVHRIKSSVSAGMPRRRALCRKEHPHSELRRRIQALPARTWLLLISSSGGRTGEEEVMGGPLFDYLEPVRSQDSLSC